MNVTQVKVPGAVEANPIRRDRAGGLITVQNQTLTQICKKPLCSSSYSLAIAPTLVAHPDLPKFPSHQDKKLPSLLLTKGQRKHRGPQDG